MAGAEYDYLRLEWNEHKLEAAGEQRNGSSMSSRGQQPENAQVLNVHMVMHRPDRKPA
jgi:hypothetical protein